MRTSAGTSLHQILLVCVAAALVGCTTAIPPADSANQAGATDSAATEFVSSFYRAYWPRAHAGLAAFDSVLTTSPTLFAPDLRIALQRDAAARAAARSAVAGIDWDPVMGSQDPCPDFRIGHATRTGSRVRVAIHAVCAERHGSEIPVTAEVAYAGTSWAFTNFIYAPPAGDLLQALRTLGYSDD